MAKGGDQSPSSGPRRSPQATAEEGMLCHVACVAVADLNDGSSCCVSENRPVGVGTRGGEKRAHRASG